MRPTRCITRRATRRWGRDSPVGPWTYRGVILSSDATRKGPGHHSILQLSGGGGWRIVYHRWEGQAGDGPYRGLRQICIDVLEYDAEGLLRPVRMTGGGEADGR